ncbi:hypothetical protein CSUI_004774, partial [Cystoisospora suis]
IMEMQKRLPRGVGVVWTPPVHVRTKDEMRRRSNVLNVAAEMLVARRIERIFEGKERGLCMVYSHDTVVER